MGNDFTDTFFTVGAHINFGNPLDYFRLISHAAGHSDWNHLLGNFSMILILGPGLEEKYGTKNLLMMSLVTALITGILNVAFLDTGLRGASGLVFMMIVLSSFSNFRSGTIPLTFVLVLIIYVGQEVLLSFQTDNISHFAHILGGLCGSFFGFGNTKSLSGGQS
jgi:membrane associated rhomboid family serine protease